MTIVVGYIDAWPAVSNEGKKPCNPLGDVYVERIRSALDRAYNPRHVPVIPTRVGFVPASCMQVYPSAYWYVANREMLWSLFDKFGLIIHRK